MIGLLRLADSIIPQDCSEEGCSEAAGDARRTALGHNLRRDKTPDAGLESRRAGERDRTHSLERSEQYGDSYRAAARDLWIPGEHSQAISELHWRRVDQTRLGQLLRECDAGHRAVAVRDSALECCRHRQGD